MSYIKVIEKVNSFVVTGNFEILWFNGKVTLNDIKIIDEKIFDIEYFKRLLFIQINEGKNTVIYNLDLKSVKNLNYVGKVLNEKIILVGKWNDNYTERITSAISWEDNTTIWQTKRGFYKILIQDSNFIAVEKGILTKNSILTSFPIWSFDLKELGTFFNITNENCLYDVKYFIGVQHHKLIVQLSNATFLFLDINTGHFIEKINLNEKYPLPSPCFYNDEFKAHLTNDQLFWLSNQRLVKINLASLIVTVIKDYFTEQRENQFRFMSNTYSEGKIFFVADFGWEFVTSTRIGVMDTITGEVLWQHQLKNTGGLPEPPQVNDDNLYIRTAKGKLYVFKKLGQLV